MTDNILAFLRARLDEDALWATEASRRNDLPVAPGGVHWQWVDPDTDTVIAPSPELDDVVGGDHFRVSLRSRENWPTEWAGRLPQFAIPMAEEVPAAVGGHIVRHDPARVLAEVEAKRQILEAHEPWTAENGDVICGRCGREHIDGRPGGHYPCQTLRLLALPHAGHPDYPQEWRP